MDSLTRQVPYTTKTGVQIGIAYIPPKQNLTPEGEHLQGILLGERRTFIEKMGLGAYMIVMIAVFTALAVVLSS